MSDSTITAVLHQRFPDAMLSAHQHLGQETVLIKREAVREIARFLRDDPRLQFDFLMDLGGVDYLKFGRVLSSAPMRATPSPLPYYMNPKPAAEPWQRGVSNDAYRFEVVYHLYSSPHNHRLRLKVPLTAADPVLDSVTGVWTAANWFEREVWDMFGVRFTGHPNLRRILMYEEFKGHALRKDYPVRKRQPLIGQVY